MGGAGLVNKGFSHWSSRNGTKELRSRRKRRKQQQQHNLIICNLHCWLVPCGGRNLRGGRLFSFFSVSISYGAPTDLFNGFPFFRFSFSFFANLSMGSRRRTARAQGGRLAAAAWERNGFKARRESEREVLGPRLTKRELPPNSLFCFLHFFQSFPRLTFFCLISTLGYLVRYTTCALRCVFSLSQLSMSFSFLRALAFFLCLLFAVSVVIVLYLDLLLLAFWKEGGRGKELVGGPPGGGGGGRGSWGHGAFSRTVPTYLPTLTNKNLHISENPIRFLVVPF